MVAGGFAAALAFLFVPAPVGRGRVPAALAVYFVVATNSVSGAVADYSQQPADARAAERVVGRRARRADADVPYLFGTTPDPFTEAVALWQLEFWNRSVAGVYSLGVPAAAGIPELQATFDRPNGRIASGSPEPRARRYVVTQHDARPRRARRSRRPARTCSTRSTTRCRSRARRRRVYADGWMGSDATYDRYVGPAARSTSHCRTDALGRARQARPRP